MVLYGDAFSSSFILLSATHVGRQATRQNFKQTNLDEFATHAADIFLTGEKKVPQTKREKMKAPPSHCPPKIKAITQNDDDDGFP